MRYTRVGVWWIPESWCRSDIWGFVCDEYLISEGLCVWWIPEGLCVMNTWWFVWEWYLRVCVWWIPDIWGFVCDGYLIPEGLCVSDTWGFVCEWYLRVCVWWIPDTWGFVCDAHSAVGRVDVLPSGPGRPERVDVKVLGVHADVNLKIESFLSRAFHEPKHTGG